MLKKKLCKLCHKENGRLWNTFNDWSWKDGEVRCPAVYFFSLAETLKPTWDSTKMYAKIKDAPPGNCFYGLEQVL